MSSPKIERVRREIRRRVLQVKAKERLTPNMLRLTLSGDELDDFNSPAPDDHIKLFVPVAGGETAAREYTPRSYSTDDRELVVDFALHDAGPATAWAISAKVGDELEIGGPRGSRIVSGVSEWLLIGDETALPAIGRRVEGFSAGSAVNVLAAVASPEDEQVFQTSAKLTTRYTHRPVAEAADPEPLLSLLQSHPPTPETLVWIAAEASVTRALRNWLLEQNGFDRTWLQAKGYWTAGQADTSATFDD